MNLSSNHKRMIPSPLECNKRKEDGFAPQRWTNTRNNFKTLVSQLFIAPGNPELDVGSPKKLAIFQKKPQARTFDERLAATSDAGIYVVIRCVKPNN